MPSKGRRVFLSWLRTSLCQRRWHPIAGVCFHLTVFLGERTSCSGWLGKWGLWVTKRRRGEAHRTLAQLHYKLGEGKGAASINAAFTGRLLRILLPSMLGKHLYSDYLQTWGLEFLKTKQKAHTYNPRTTEAEMWIPGTHWPVSLAYLLSTKETQDCRVHTCHTWKCMPSHTKN